MSLRQKSFTEPNAPRLSVPCPTCGEYANGGGEAFSRTNRPKVPRAVFRKTGRSSRANSACSDGNKKPPFRAVLSTVADVRATRTHFMLCNGSLRYGEKRPTTVGVDLFSPPLPQSSPASYTRGTSDCKSRDLCARFRPALAKRRVYL